MSESLMFLCFLTRIMMLTSGYTVMTKNKVIPEPYLSLGEIDLLHESKK